MNAALRRLAAGAVTDFTLPLPMRIQRLLMRGEIMAFDNPAAKGH